MAYFRCEVKALFYKGLIGSNIFTENNNNIQPKKLFKRKPNGKTKKKIEKKCYREKVGFLRTDVVI